MAMQEWFKEVLCWHKLSEWCDFDEFRVRTCVKCGKEEIQEFDEEDGKYGAIDKK
jgi:hypothetical protein